jgi:hypothetical protein
MEEATDCLQATILCYQAKACSGLENFSVAPAKRPLGERSIMMMQN